MRLVHLINKQTCFGIMLYKSFILVDEHILYPKYFHTSLLISRNDLGSVGRNVRYFSSYKSSRFLFHNTGQYCFKKTVIYTAFNLAFFRDQWLSFLRTNWFFTISRYVLRQNTWSVQNVKISQLSLYFLETSCSVYLFYLAVRQIKQVLRSIYPLFNYLKQII